MLVKLPCGAMVDPSEVSSIEWTGMHVLLTTKQGRKFGVRANTEEEAVAAIATITVALYPPVAGSPY